MELILYTRLGCCLCEGLEEKLKAIPLQNICSDFQLSVKDIDSEKVSEVERTNYSMEVPVLAFRLNDQDLIVELPRVSPRLTKEDLFKWLQKRICEKMEKEKRFE